MGRNIRLGFEPEIGRVRMRAQDPKATLAGGYGTHLKGRDTALVTNHVATGTGTVIPEVALTNPRETSCLQAGDRLGYGVVGSG